MDGIFDRVYGLSRRGGAGLACDERGVALGPVALVEALDRGGRRVYRLRPSEEIARTLALAYGPFAADALARRLAGLDVAARALEASNLALASIATALLKLPALSPEAVAKLMAEPTLKKYSPDQPRDAQGRWTDEAGATGGAAPVQVAANDTGVMSDAGGVLPAPATLPPPPPGTGNVREYSPDDAAKLPPPPPGSKYVTLNGGTVLWTAPYKHLKGGPMLVPADVSLSDNARVGQKILAAYNEDAKINSVIAAEISDAKMAKLFGRGGEMDYQRTYGSHDKINNDYVDVGNYNYGIVAAAAGYSWTYAAAAATVVNWTGGGDKSGRLGSNPRNLEIARRGYDDYKAGKIIHPRD